MGSNGVYPASSPKSYWNLPRVSFGHEAGSAAMYRVCFPFRIVILFNLSGHGLIDMASYDQYLAGNLMNYELKDEDIQKNLDEIKDM